MAPLPLILFTAWVGAAEPAAPPVAAECPAEDAAKIRESFPKARDRVQKAIAAVDRAITGEDPEQKKKIVGYADILGVGPQDLPQIARILRLMDGVLDKSSFACGGNDGFCKSRAGYVQRGERDEKGREVVHLCAGAFKDAETRARTITHEAAHLVDPQIGGANGEAYCPVFDCDGYADGEQRYLVADNWAHFTHCASGQKPDEGFVITPTKKPKKKR